MVSEEWVRPEHITVILHGFGGMGKTTIAMTVILYGFGGMGKTTIVEVVFSLGQIEECKHDEVIHFDIIQLQKLMLKDLMGA